MRIIEASDVYKKVKEITKKANFVVDDEILFRLEEGRTKETDSLSQKVLEEMIDNIKIAKEKHIPICQDTGIVVVFVEIGEDVFIQGSMISSINQAVKEAYLE